MLRVRDGMDDVSVAVLGHDAIKDRDCGNAVIIAHADGFQTDYCHMAKGSVAVKAGDDVGPASRSGASACRATRSSRTSTSPCAHDGRVVDPFDYGQAEGACAGGTSLWRAALQPSLAYKNGTVLNFGLAPTAVTMEQVDDGAGRDPLAPDSPAVLAYCAGDRPQARRRPAPRRHRPRRRAGRRSEPPLPSNKDQVFIGIGRRRPPGGWGPGIYAAHYTVTRDGAAVVDRSVETRIGSAPTGPSGP